MGTGLKAGLINVAEGADVRVRWVSERGFGTPPGFRTDRIARGNRVGTFPAKVIAVCGAGCHVVVRAADGNEVDVDIDQVYAGASRASPTRLVPKPGCSLGPFAEDEGPEAG